MVEPPPSCADHSISSTAEEPSSRVLSGFCSCASCHHLQHGPRRQGHCLKHNLATCVCWLGWRAALQASQCLLVGNNELFTVEHCVFCGQLETVVRALATVLAAAEPHNESVFMANGSHFLFTLLSLSSPLSPTLSPHLSLSLTPLTSLSHSLPSR